MTTIRERMLDRDRDRFVGRNEELDLFARMLDGNDPHRIVHVVGQGGIGKSALLRAVSRIAADRNIDTVWIDGRDLTPFPADVGTAVAGIERSSPALVVFDSYELVSSLDSHLRSVVIPDLPDSTIVVFATRQAPSPAWFEQGWDTLVQVIDLGPLDDASATELVRNFGLDDDAWARKLVQQSHGSPLALTVGAESNTHSASFGDLADRLLRDEVEPGQFRTLGVAALARVTTPELLADVLHEDDPHESYKWLADRSFAEPLATGVTLHALVTDVVRARLRELDPVGEGAVRRRIADHLHRRAVAGNDGLSTDLQHLIVDPMVRWGYSSDVGRRFRIDVLRDGDIEQIAAILHAVGVGPWWDVTQVIFERHPELVSVARDWLGAIGGYAVTVTPTNAPQLAHDDVLLGPWLAYARDTLHSESAVMWRESVDLTGELGEVTSLLGAGGLIASGASNPRYLFLPIAPEIPAAQQFSDRLDGRHVPELDLHAYGMNLECHIVDNGPGGLIGKQRDWIYRETGATPPPALGDVDGTDLLKLLRDPTPLSTGPGWLGDSPSTRLETLRALAESSLDVFGSAVDDQLARSIVVAAYLSDNRPHEAIARELHLSRSAYFRRLHTASQRLASELAARATRLH